MKKLLGILLCFLSMNVFAEPVKEFIVFGDSLSDNGNLYEALLKVVPKSPPYFKGRFSNGPTWAENVGKYLYDKEGADYRIYAYGGATALWRGSIYTLDYEVSQYVASSLLKDKSQSLYVIWIGANDYLFEPNANPEKIVHKVVSKIKSTVSFLISIGAKHIVVMSLPDLGKTPYATKQGENEKLHQLGLLHNQELLTAVNGLKKSNSLVQIELFNTYEVFNDFIENVAVFNQRYNVNIKNTTDSCWLGKRTFTKADINTDLHRVLTDRNVDTSAISHFISASPTVALAYRYSVGDKPCDHAEEYVFWDDLHPSEVSHYVLGKIFAERFFL